MCPPVIAAASAITSIAQAGAGFAGAAQQARAQNRAYRENAHNALIAAQNERVALEIRRDQQAAAAGQQEFNTALEGLKQRSTARTAAGSAGVQGSSVDQYVQSLFAQEGRIRDSIDQQLDVDMQNNQIEQQNVVTRAQSRINSVQRAVPPSPLPFVLQGVSGVLNAVSAYQRSTSPNSRS